MSDYRTIKLDRDGGVATITIARPDKLNALTPKVFEEMSAAIDAAIADSARAIVLTGEGRAFCSGADLAPDQYGYEGLPNDLGQVLDAAYNPFARKIAALDVPVITAINGLAAGAGCGLAISGDISVMARDAYLLLAFVNIGLVPDAGTTWFVAKGVGRTKALEMALLGEKLSAEEALAAGLVTRVSDNPLADAQAIAAKLAAGPTLAIAAIRKQVASALTATLDETLEIERSNQSRVGFSRDFKEAVAAFGEKRPPVFQGH